MSKNRICLLCGETDYETILSYDEPDQYENVVSVSPKGYFRKWVKCTKCGLLYSIFSRDEFILDQIYTEAYRDPNAAWRDGTTEQIFNKVIHLPFSESETKFRIHWIKSNIKDLYKYGIKKRNSSPLNMLDIGGGNAVFAYEFQDEDWKVFIVDANASGEFIENKLGIPFVRDYYRPNLFDQKFDLISLIFVLEHLRNPRLILREICNDLDSESLLYIEVPDANAFEIKKKEDDIFNSCHLYMFSPTTLALLLYQCGFEIMCIKRVRTVRDHLAIMLLAKKDLDRGKSNFRTI